MVRQMGTDHTSRCRYQVGMGIYDSTPELICPWKRRPMISSLFNTRKPTIEVGDVR